MFVVVYIGLNMHVCVFPKISCLWNDEICYYGKLRERRSRKGKMKQNVEKEIRNFRLPSLLQASGDTLGPQHADIWEKIGLLSFIR